LAEETGFKINYFHNFRTLVTVTLTLDRVKWRTVVYHVSTSTYID